jgi:hypothetical protein
MPLFFPEQWLAEYGVIDSQCFEEKNLITLLRSHRGSLPPLLQAPSSVY